MSFGEKQWKLGLVDYFDLTVFILIMIPRQLPEFSTLLESRLA